MDTKKLAKELKQKLDKYDSFTGLYLFGSRVKGTHKPTSDIDIVGVFTNEDSLEKQLDISGEVLDIELEYDVIIDFKYMTKEELEFNWVFFDEVKKGFYYAAG